MTEGLWCSLEEWAEGFLRIWMKKTQDRWTHTYGCRVTSRLQQWGDSQPEDVHFGYTLTRRQKQNAIDRSKFDQNMIRQGWIFTGGSLGFPDKDLSNTLGEELGDIFPTWGGSVPIEQVVILGGMEVHDDAGSIQQLLVTAGAGDAVVAVPAVASVVELLRLHLATRRYPEWYRRERGGEWWRYRQAVLRGVYIAESTEVGSV